MMFRVKPLCPAFANLAHGLASLWQESCEYVDPSDKRVLPAEEIANRIPATTPADWIFFATSWTSARYSRLSKVRIWWREWKQNIIFSSEALGLKCW